jgi:hypothetical protein
MENALDFIEKRRWGIIVTFMAHVGLLLYLQIETYDFKLPESTFEVMSEVTEYDDYIEINPDHVITEEEFNANSNADVRNMASNANDKRERSYDNYSSSSIDSKVEQNARDLEQQYFNEFASGRPNASGGEQNSSNGGASTPSNTNSSTKPNNSDNTNAANQGGGNQYAGKTMVKYELVDRVPHNNNDWHVRNPGYTCGSNSNGIVAVAIRVNQNGDVVSARYVAEMSNGANSCMIEQAERYAKMSRFAYSGGAPKSQDGFIYYTFVSRK